MKKLVILSVLLLIAAVGASFLIASTTDGVNFCSAADTCELPMEYAVRSNCPFSAVCLEGQCKVACFKFEHAEPLSTPVTCKVDSDCVCDHFIAADKHSCQCVDGQCAAVME